MSQKAPQIGDFAAEPKAYPRRAECVVELMRFELTTSAVRLQGLWIFFGLPGLSLVY